MPQPIMIGLIAALGTLGVGVLSLTGVLVATHFNWKLGKRTGDIQQAGIGVQQQTVDVERNEQLFEENQKLRKENQEQYTANRQMRHEADQWDEERKALCRDLQTAQAEIALREGRIAFLETSLERSEAECRFALAAQATAEGGLKTAMKTLAEFSPCS